ncbi:Vacuolar protein sorting-associated protein 9a [Psilocybe cubensis]|uniref:Vacuolar protein sorting-associated protein 9a n=2 Tax=Psilocybe cubensis TaxID=181762 RepID=A0A8H7XV73_PSICU|nr:Vacuolar protein sorting-associated protein 9a [Psilocybe cubensis]KAH9479330.1 Vacuolar protein sorting-associated protein 9a [Psilocybe cubensis]
MASSQKPKLDPIGAATDNLPSPLVPDETPIASLATPDIPLSANPWNDSPAESSSVPSPKEKPAIAPLDPSLFEQPIFAGLNDGASTPEPKREVTKEVLSEFDPLASQEEKAAREAWETSESHPPPPPQPRTPTPPVPPLKDLYITSPTSPGPPTADSSGATAITSPSSFPSFAAFAKSFSIPLRNRPLSLDASAKAVPSPSTISSFASQQAAPATQRPDGKAVASGSSTPNRTGSGSASPVPKASDGGFDFQKFLDQMKTKSADPVSKYLRSFLSNFAKRTFTVNDQMKIINDFLVFIAAQMRECDVWRNATETEFENAMEGMEKLVMNRLYDFTFTPQLVHANPPRPITTDDLERDRVLSQRIALFGWLEEKHLDVPEGEGSKGFLMFAEQELLKINHYKAPRDKLICILNCCKVIFGLIRHLHKEEGADSFVPILIFVVLKANPEHLLSNVEFINRFRNPSKLQSEAGYYLSSLMGAVSFIESMDHTSLSCITQEEFEKNVEEAIQALPPSEPQSPEVPFAEAKMRGLNTLPASPHAGEESAQPLAISTPTQTLSEDAKRLLQKTQVTISKPLNAIGRIFTEALDGAENKLSYLPGPFAPFELGREGRTDGPSGSGAPPVPQWSHPNSWQDGPHSAQTPHTPYGDAPYSAAIQTPYKPRVRRMPSSPGNSPGYGPEETPSRMGPYTHHQLAMGPSQPVYQQQALQIPRVQSLADEGAHISRTPTPALDFAGVQAQIDTATENAAAASRDTLRQIFPAVDVEVVEWVLEANEGDLGKSIEQLLDIGGGA